MVQCYSPGSASVHPHLIHAFLGPPESKSKTASRSVQPFLHSSRQGVIILHYGPPLSPLTLPLHMEDLDPIKYMVPWDHPSPQLKQHLNRFSCFCRVHYRDRQTDRLADHATRSVTIGRIYTMGHKKGANLFLPVTASKINGF